ncbi:CU044_5270 family protein [Streptomyces sp. Rer75]|uniref:CU044_5270 family protein n=1 Tax=Streptomyces sp. Rer75 TaxID=2750011 RepID=UPI0015CFA6D5|nr:CU044_5270 family protein [Streptomyces sp. Rer75]QLH24236.1 CU044_5270 family protein [Streptomyces sp. Rer75]
MNASPSQSHPAEWPETQALRDTTERGLPAGRHAFHREQLMAQIRDDIRTTAPVALTRQRNPFLRKAVLLPAAACALAGAIVGGVALSGDDGDGTTPLATGPALTTRLGTVDAEGGPQLLDRISLAAADASGPTVRDGQFIYIASKVASTYPKTVDDKTTVVSQELHARQVWQSLDGKDGWLIEPGETDDAGITLAGPHASSAAYDHLATLPTDPDALLKKIDRELDPDREVPRDQAAFVALGDLLTESYPPAKLTAAIYKAAAKIPGVVKVDDAVDATGRHGVAVARLNEQDGQRTEWIFDRKTLAFLGERSVQVEPDESGLFKVGTVTFTSAIMQRAVVDGNKQMPAEQQAG